MRIFRNGFDIISNWKELMNFNSAVSDNLVAQTNAYIEFKIISMLSLD